MAVPAVGPHWVLPFILGCAPHPPGSRPLWDSHHCPLPNNTAATAAWAGAMASVHTAASTHARPTPFQFSQRRASRSASPAPRCPLCLSIHSINPGWMVFPPSLTSVMTSRLCPAASGNSTAQLHAPRQAGARWQPAALESCRCRQAASAGWGGAGAQWVHSGHCAGAAGPRAGSALWEGLGKAKSVPAPAGRKHAGAGAGREAPTAGIVRSRAAACTNLEEKRAGRAAMRWMDGFAGRRPRGACGMWYVVCGMWCVASRQHLACRRNAGCLARQLQAGSSWIQTWTGVTIWTTP